MHSLSYLRDKARCLPGISFLSLFMRDGSRVRFSPALRYATRLPNYSRMLEDPTAMPHMPEGGFFFCHRFIRQGTVMARRFHAHDLAALINVYLDVHMPRRRQFLLRSPRELSGI